MQGSIFEEALEVEEGDMVAMIVGKESRVTAVFMYSIGLNSKSTHIPRLGGGNLEPSQGSNSNVRAVKYDWQDNLRWCQCARLLG